MKNCMDPAYDWKYDKTIFVLKKLIKIMYIFD